jgi:hypothetical protein
MTHFIQKFAFFMFLVVPSFPFLIKQFGKKENLHKDA